MRRKVGYTDHRYRLILEKLWQKWLKIKKKKLAAMQLNSVKNVEFLTLPLESGFFLQKLREINAVITAQCVEHYYKTRLSSEISVKSNL